eukprot:5950450-Prymnesium_polylepis.1
MAIKRDLSSCCPNLWAADRPGVAVRVLLPLLRTRMLRLVAILLLFSQTAALLVGAHPGSA